MERRLIKKKKLLLSVVRQEEYSAILRFLESIYLSSYDLKIFKARKMSNLFMALKELLLAEDGGRVRYLYEEKFKKAGKEEPVVIADWALDYLDIAYPDRKVKKVLLIDDIIIHGRTLANLYDSVKQKFEDVEIDVKTYAKNKSDHLDHPAINNASAEDVGSVEKCRRYSQIFVDIFMAINQPYTSYVPNIAVRLTENDRNEECVRKDTAQFMNWMEVHKAANNSYDDVKGKIPFYKTTVWSDKSEFGNILFTSIRTYLNTESADYAVVPMVSLRPISQDTLRKQLKILADRNIFKEPFATRWKASAAEMKTMDYRAIVYSVSTLWGRYFFAKEQQFKSCIDKHEFELFEEERMSFGKPLLDREIIGRMDEARIRELLIELENAYTAVDTDIFTDSSSEIRELNRVMEEEILPEFPEERTRKDWEEIIREFLHRDSDEDEKHWKKNRDKIVQAKLRKESPKRIPGLPIVMIIEKAEGEELQSAFEEILKAIDHGEGSIVPEQIIGKNGKVYFVSSLHAGEQNYKYLEQKYYPVLYGMWQIERKKESDRKQYQKEILSGIADSRDGLRQLEEDCTNEKRALLEMYGMSQNKFLKDLVENSVTDEYASPLDLDFYMYANDERLAEVVGAFYRLTGS